MPISPDQLGQAMGSGYRVERPVGSGGMASVFLATDLRHGRRVAVKVLAPEIALAAGPDRFAKEIAIVARLTHPNILPLYDSGASGGLAWFVMPFVDGPSLHARIRDRGKLPVGDAVRIALEVSDALAHAHAAGIVHRDIKPDNILLEADHAVVADFGVARAIAGITGQTPTTTLPGIGTPAYMSPEQSVGDGPVDGRSDIYSLALVLHEMLSGQLPPRTVTPEGGHLAVRRGGGDRGGGVPRAFQRVLARALATDPGERFQTAESFAAALRAAGERHASRRGRYAAGWAAVGAAGALGGYLLLKAPVLEDPPSPRRIVIAPLANRTGQPEFDPVGEIASDWLAGGLQRTGMVEIVPSETAIEAYRRVQADSSRRRADPVRALARETGAGIVVSGAYYLQGERLLLRIQVADAASGTLLDAPEDVAAPVADPLEGIVALRSRLMGWLGVHYDPRLEGHQGDAPPEYHAYQVFAEGMNHYVANRNAAAAPLFLRAWQLDSTFTLGLLYASIARTNTGDDAGADSLLRLAERDRDRLSEYHRAWLDSRKAFVAGNSDAALRAIRRAAELAPRSKAVYNLAVAAFQAGALDEARATLERLGHERGPMQGFFPYWDLLGAVHHARGDYEAERRVAGEARRRYPGRLAAVIPAVRALAAEGKRAALARELAAARGMKPDPIGWTVADLALESAAEELVTHGHADAAEAVLAVAAAEYQAMGDTAAGALWGRVRVAYARGDLGEAARALERVGAGAPRVERLGMEGLIAAHRGDTALARVIGDSLGAVPVRFGFGAASLYRARIAAVLGEPERAMALLRQAFQEGKEYDLWLHRDRDLARLRGHPGFEELVRGTVAAPRD